MIDWLSPLRLTGTGEEEGAFDRKISRLRYAPLEMTCWDFEFAILKELSCQCTQSQDRLVGPHEKTGGRVEHPPVCEVFSVSLPTTPRRCRRATQSPDSPRWAPR